MKTHGLKTWPIYFEAIERGSKTFEFRKDDRNFEIGDHLELREWNILNEHYTGKSIFVEVTYKLAGYTGMTPGYCILGIKKINLKST